GTIERVRSASHDLNANVPSIDQKDVEKFANQQTNFMEKIKGVSGDNFTEVNGQEDWRPLVDAGVLYVDSRCERYIDALFWLSRARKAGSKQTQYLGSAAAAAAEILSASRELIALTPLGVTLVDQTINNIGESLLYDLDPSAVRKIVKTQQAAYMAAIDGVTYSNQTSALRAVHGYLSICLPAAIETQVNQAVGRAAFVEKTKDKPIAGQANGAAQDGKPQAQNPAAAPQAAPERPTPPVRRDYIPVIIQAGAE
ncbi:MAG TPA: hypothetical protein VIG90_05860, partial [Pedomonas sp.]|uniref:hypothetical protein n=1 Tax=Pedomonas sp. TaxID=2976421 RepID=UPI002F412424